MNERISDLMDLASDDGGAPLGFSGAAVAHRARSERRRRRAFGGAAVGLAAAGVAGVLVATQLLASPHGTALGANGQSATTGTQSGPGSSSGATLTAQQQAIVTQCASAHLPSPVVRAPSGQGGFQRPTKGEKVQGTGPGPQARFLTGWTVDAFVQDDLGLTATFVNPAHTRWASCDLAAGGTQDADGVVDEGALPAGPVPQSWYGPNGFRHQASSPSWSQVCTTGEGKICAHELYAGAFARYDGVQAVRVDAPDGTVLTPVLGTYTYVFRHAEKRVDAHRAADDMQPHPSMPVTLLDGHGHTIIRYDYYPSYVVPSSCPPTGGC